MNVDLPDTGCNILISSTSFYNYSSDLHTRDQYYIYEGVARKQSSSYSQYGYTYSGDCLNDGDLVYRPELQVYFPFLAFIVCSLIGLLCYNIFIKRLLR